jgi:hypothetical protein
MGQVFNELKRHPEVYTDAPYSMALRAANDRRRHAKLLLYDGPDSGTVELLRANLDTWEHNPSSFWTFAEPNLVLDPLIGIAMCYRRIKQFGP